jgi:ribosomal protein L37E
MRAAISIAKSVCARCGFTLYFHVREAEGQPLIRCPHCTAYDWQLSPSGKERP